MTILFTAVAVAFFITVSLKFLHYFHFITWNPIRFLKNVTYMDWTTFEKWIVLFFILMFVAALIYFLAQTILGKSPFVFSIIVGLILALVIEWRILNLSFEWASIKKVSIPFIVLVLIALRFVTEKAQYFQKQMFR